MTIPFPRVLFLTFLILLVGCKNDSEQQEMPNYKAELAYEIPAALGEGALWNYKTQQLYWVDIEGFTFNIYDPSNSTNVAIKTPSRAGTVVPYTEDKIIVALQDGIHSLNIQTGTTQLITDMAADLEGSRLNDGKCDPSGRLWVGSMHFNQIEGAANLFMINKDSSYVKKKEQVTISNGIVWSKDKQTMYYIDTPSLEIKAYDYDNANGEISNERIAVKIPKELGSPDGMTIDGEDKLWVGMWGGNAVLRFDPESGEVIAKVAVPAKNVTACAFGGKDLDTLYITTSSLGMTDEEQEKYPLAGSIFKVVPGAKGVHANFFKQ